MPYTVAITALDIAVPPVLGLLTFSGFLFTLFPFPPDIATLSPSPIVFPAALSGALPASIMISDVGAPGGQLFRSGPLALLPSSPGAVTVIMAVGSIPAVTPTSAPTTVSLASLASSAIGTSGIDVPLGDWEAPVKILFSALFAGTVPHKITISSATVTPTAAGSIDVTLRLRVDGRLLFIIPITANYTITSTFSVVPSGDAANASRIVRVIPRPSLATPLAVRLLGPKIAGILEPIFNAGIQNAVDTLLAARMPPSRRTPTCVISARAVTITTGGIRLQIALGDFGPAIVTVAPPTALAMTITPDPVEGVVKSYVVRVVNAGTLTGVTGATVTLTNRGPNAGAPVSQLVGSDGSTTFVAVKLAVTVQGGNPHTGVPPTRLLPFLTATAPGATPATLVLQLPEIT